jgi:hypothetical protein
MNPEEKPRRESEAASKKPENVVAMPGAVPIYDEQGAIEDLIAGFTEPNDAWKVSVYRLTEPGRHDSASQRAFLATLPVTEDLLDSIRDKFGGGNYSLEFKQRGRIKKKGNVSIEGLPDSENDEFDEPLYEPLAPAEPSEQERRLDRIERALEMILEQGQSGVQMQAQVAPLNPLTSLRDAMKLMQEMQRLNVEMTPARTLVGDDDEERALVLLLKDENLRSKISTGLMSAIGNGDSVQQEPWFSKVLAAVAQNPVLSARALNLVERLTGTASAVDVPVAASPVMPVGTGAAEEAEADDEGNDAVQIINDLIARLATNAPISEGVELVREYVRICPEQATSFGMMMYAPTDQVLGLLVSNVQGGEQIAQLPHARKWVESLQRELRKGAGGESRQQGEERG